MRIARRSIVMLIVRETRPHTEGGKAEEAEKGAEKGGDRELRRSPSGDRMRCLVTRSRYSRQWLQYLMQNRT